MNSLDSISREVLMLLLRSPVPLASGEIAERLEVSRRMIRYRLDGIRLWLGDRGEDLIVRPNYGIGLESTPEIRRALLGEIENLSGYHLVLSRSERVNTLIFYLLASDDPLSSSVLTEELGVSRTTLYKDLDLAEEWFFDQEVALVRTPRLGTSLDLTEFKRRVLLESYLLDMLGEMSLLNLCSGSRGAIKARLSSRVKLQKVLLEWFASLDLKWALDRIKRIEKALDFQFTDNAYGPLAFQLALQANRIRSGHRIVLASAQLKELRNLPIFREVAGLEMELLAGSLPEQREQETAYLVMHLLGAQRRYSVSSILEGLPAQDAEFQQIVDHVMQTASVYLHPGLVWDGQLAQNLAFHLQTTLVRLRFGLPIRNPHLAESRRKYPYIHKVARICCVYLSSQTGRIIPEEEIGKITIQLAAAMERLRSRDQVKKKVIVVCGEGVSTAWLVISRLNAVFPDIEVLEIMSWTQVSERTRFPGDMDGMISTVPLEIPGIPIVQVSPMLTEADQERIRLVIQSGQMPGVAPRVEQEGTSLIAIIKPEHIQVKVPAEDWQDVVWKSSQLLVDSGTIDQRYIQAMLDALAQHGPYMVVFPGVVLLHASPVRGVNRLGLSLVTLDQPVKFGHPDHDPVQIAIVLAAEDAYSHVNALMELIEDLRDKTLIKALLDAEHPREIIQAFTEARKQ